MRCSVGPRSAHDLVLYHDRVLQVWDHDLGIGGHDFLGQVLKIPFLPHSTLDPVLTSCLNYLSVTLFATCV